MAGIYVHIPFCTSKCHYCNFLSTVSLKHRAKILKALEIELELRQNYLDGDAISTLYFGGGTPSMLEINELELILNAITRLYKLDTNPEITLEANPDDITLEKAKNFKKIGFNRLSIGNQAFDDQLLKKLNRLHTAQQSLDAIKYAKKAGFDNLSVDFIYGIPGLSNEQWKEEIKKALSLEIQHISAYHLTVEPNTALDLLIKKNKFQAIDELQGADQFEILIEMLESAGFEHYEISNFSLKGFRSKHNSAYWRQEKYMGIGPSAHSYNLLTRQWNTLNLLNYFSELEKGNLPCEMETLSKKDQFNEFVMLGLRTSEGISSTELRNKFTDFEADFIKVTEKFFKLGLMEYREGKYLLTRKGKFMADGMASDFFQ